MAAVQSTEPHLHTPSFFEAPLPSKQGSAWLQVLKEALQKSPVSPVHGVVPQTQFSELALAPVPSSQTGAVKAHRQALEEE